jgi:acetyl-CoA carboxylase carboxyl transferase subunit alpha
LVIVCTVIGEGGSGGALAIGVGDHLMMLQYSTYSVISPEGCAAILWKDAAKAPEAAEALGITAPRLKELGLIDEIIEEPAGGAHRDVPLHMANVKQALLRALDQVSAMPMERLLERRYQRLMSHGHYMEKA